MSLADPFGAAKIDIYEEVKEQDGIWSEIIKSGESVKVRFEKRLTNKNETFVLN
jgi:hypothetical protein